MQSLYPTIRFYQKRMLSVGGEHQLYIEESGDPRGLPVIFIHGGPGRACHEDFRRFFDPNVYRIILFDQRGCGHSTPHSALTDNSIATTVEDIEKIRQALQLDHFILVGEDFGCLLALFYAEQYPQYVKGMILQGAMLNRKDDLKWLFTQNGVRQIFPEYWSDFCEHMALHDQQDILPALIKRLQGSDDLARMATAKAWALWNARISTLNPNTYLLEQWSDSTIALPYAKVATHFFVNDCLPVESGLFSNMQNIKHIPGVIIHGRYDMVSPVQNAWELHRAWQSSQLHIIRDAGHAVTEPMIVDAMIHATMDMAERYFAA